MNDMCPLCQEREVGNFKKPLDGISVCKKCYYSMANRRQIAYIIDAVVFYGILTNIANVVLLMMMVGSISTYGNAGQSADDGLFSVIQLVLAWLVWPAMFFCKDGFSGYSLGKLATGVRVVQVDDMEKPIGFLQSFKRNLILYIPIVPLVVAFTLGKGQRLGDGWAKTRVVWQRRIHMPFYSQRPVCHGCQYDLRGCISDTCPECGEVISAENIERIEEYQEEMGKQEDREALPVG